MPNLKPNMKLDMKTRTILFVAIASTALLGVLPANVWAADPAMLDFENHGEISVGYRFSDISGYRPKFLELFNLRSGFRVENISLRGQAGSRAKSFSDGYTLSATGLGGDT